MRDIRLEDLHPFARVAELGSRSATAPERSALMGWMPFAHPLTIDGRHG
ncbi:hypothetical protein [Acidovorax sp. sic0104]|nr:hypothetical protein [Acidovorax sp. sic0104]MBV7543952.1 hypothetical protein [Acidovorax sp. sic0104]